MIGLLKLFVKSIIAFTLSFCVLSIPIGNETVFERISEHVQPFDEDFVDKTKEAVKVSIQNTKDIGKQFIKNTTPSAYEKKKVIHVQRNALSNDEQKEKGPSKNDRPETYNDSDKRKLDTIFN